MADKKIKDEMDNRSMGAAAGMPMDRSQYKTHDQMMENRPDDLISGQEGQSNQALNQTGEQHQPDTSSRKDNS